eukprot:TRINITY_DN44182_c0_g1_i1.p1 TRINITY_DN44182_c0_g1~~TRINITY_DN44182_c0_g1_i1.p1  ORF type:complete len:121 (-),score=4.62 TRINITY_DN44182_c0_g1_i1:377-739(-)
MSVALGDTYTGVFSSDDALWDAYLQASLKTGQRAWRMPLHDAYLKELKETEVADLKNASDSRLGGACSAAMFLKQFTNCAKWMHIDMAGTMCPPKGSYMGSGMTGGPVRTLIELARNGTF